MRRLMLSLLVFTLLGTACFRQNKVSYAESTDGLKNPVPIYSARFVKPGETFGMHLYNYVYVDGTFRLAGKMEAAKG